MVTREQLEALRRQQPEARRERHYTIGGSVETAVHSDVEAERIGVLGRCDRVLSDAVRQFRDNMLFKSREGLARSHFARAGGRTNDKERTR